FVYLPDGRPLLGPRQIVDIDRGHDRLQLVTCRPHPPRYRPCVLFDICRRLKRPLETFTIVRHYSSPSLSVSPSGVSISRKMLASANPSARSSSSPICRTASAACISLTSSSFLIASSTEIVDLPPVRISIISAISFSFFGSPSAHVIDG